MNRLFSALLFLTLSAAYSFASPPTSGLVFSLPADGVLADGSGNGNPVAAAQGVTFAPNRFGEPDSACRFSSTQAGSGFIKVADADLLDTDTAFTLAAWAKLDAYGTTVPSTLFAKWWTAASAADYALWVNTNGTLTFTVGGLDSVGLFKTDNLKTTARVPLGEWVHVAATFDNGVLAVYLNGTPVGSKTSSLVKKTLASEYISDDLYLGALTGWDYRLQGAMDEVRIYNRALSETEVANFLDYLPTPVISLGSGTYAGTQTVALSVVGEGWTIRYTLDGTVPTAATGTVYTVPVKLNGENQLRAVTTRAGFTLTSPVASANYTVNLGPVGGLALYLPLDGNLQDASGNNAVVTSVNAASAADRKGFANRAYDFNTAPTGAMNMKVLDSAALDADNTFTLGAWVKVNSYNATTPSVIFSKWFSAASYGDFTLWINPNGTLSFTVANTDTGVIKIDSVRSAITVPIGVWTHVAATFNNGVMSVYINAIQQGTFTSTAVTHSETKEYGSDDLYLGALYSGAYKLNGSVDEIRFYNRSLSNAEISIMSELLPAPVMTPPPGPYTSVVNVALASPISGFTVRYTTDGTSPTTTNGTLYAGTLVPVSGTMNITSALFFGDSKMTGDFVGRYTTSFGPADNLMLYLAMDGNANDTSGKNNAVTGYNLVSTGDVWGRPAMAYALEQTATGGARIKVADSANLDTDTAFTLSAWVKLNAYGTSNSVIFSKWLSSASAGDYLVWVNPNGTLTFNVASTESGTVKIDSLKTAAKMPLGTWTHVAFTFNGGAMSIYIDGVLAGSKTSTLITKTEPKEYGSDDLYIGSMYSKLYPLSGDIDEVRVYSRALSQSDLLTLRDGVSGPSAKVAAPVFTQAGGTYDSPRSVAITTATPWASIRYTLDGTEPSSSAGTLYNAPVSISTSMTLRAVAYKNFMLSSETSSAAYTILPGVPADLTAVGGDGQVTLSWSAAPRATSYNVYYSTQPGVTPANGTLLAVGGPGAVVYGLVNGASYYFVVTSVSADGEGAPSVQRAVLLRLPNASAERIAVGWNTSMALTGGGDVLSWGSNYDGQFGDGTTTRSGVDLPKGWSETSKALSVAGGSIHGLALDRDGTVWAFGSNGPYGALGNNSPNVNSYTPTKVPGLGSVVQLAAGGESSYALKTDGSLWSWGRNDDGRLGLGYFGNTPTGTDGPNPLPLRVSGPGGSGYLTGVKAVSASSSHAVVAREDGTVWAFGWNQHGQVDGSFANTPWPKQVGDLQGAVGVAAANFRSFALKSDGTVWTWGLVEAVRFNGSTNNAVPVQVAGLDSIVAISSRTDHALALRRDGTVWAWGYNASGQLGQNNYDNDMTPRKVLGPLGVGYLEGIVAVATGWNHSLALAKDGTVWAWGENEDGQLGNGTRSRSPVPVRVSGVEANPLAAPLNLFANGSETQIDLSWDAVQGADSYEIYRSDFPGATGVKLADPILPGYSDTTAAAGKTYWYSLVALSAANASPRSAQVSGALRPTGAPSAYLDMEGGYYHSIVLKADGTFLSWGWNQHGQLGDGSTSDALTPVKITAANSILQITGGNSHTIALKSDKTVIAWGYNYHGELGNGTTSGETPNTAPVQVRLVDQTPLSGISQVSAGFWHNLALETDGTVWAWGNNDWGQLGNGSVTPAYGAVPNPVKVAGLEDVVSIAAGHWSSYAVKSDGTVWAWGNNQYGQLGDGSTSHSNVPVQVKGVGGAGVLTGIRSVASGGGFAVALALDGKLYSWGFNGCGEVGDGTTQQRNTPVAVLNASSIEAIDAGYWYVLALKSNGTVLSWGQNHKGQLARGGVPNADPVPTQVPSLSNVVSLHAGAIFGCALKIDNSLVCWGENNHGQVGDGTRLDVYTPTRITLSP